MIDKPAITKSAEVHAAMVHVTVPRSEIQKVMGPGLGEVNATIAAQGIKPAGPWFTHHLKMDPEVFDFEICVPVKKPVSPSGRVKPGRIKAGQRVARTVYHGNYEGLGAAWGEFLAWVDSQGLKTASDLWEFYTTGPESSPDPGSWRTELVKPLLE
jgi:effector-binding domain-containing protein